MLHAHRHERYQDREDITGEHRWGDTAQLIMLGVFLAVWVVDAFVFKWSTRILEGVPVYVNLPIGLLLMVTAGFLACKGLRTVFGEVRDVPGLIQTGVFAHVRHPIYLGSMLVYLGLVVLSLSLISLIPMIMAWVLYFVLCRHEERLLIERFGDDYREYMRRVPMLLPRIRPAGG